MALEPDGARDVRVGNEVEPQVSAKEEAIAVIHCSAKPRFQRESHTAAGYGLGGDAILTRHHLRVCLSHGFALFCAAVFCLLCAGCASYPRIAIVDMDSFGVDEVAAVSSKRHTDAEGLSAGPSVGICMVSIDEASRQLFTIQAVPGGVWFQTVSFDGEVVHGRLLPIAVSRVPQLARTPVSETGQFRYTRQQERAFLETALKCATLTRGECDSVAELTDELGDSKMGRWLGDSELVVLLRVVSRGEGQRQLLSGNAIVVVNAVNGDVRIVYEGNCILGDVAVSPKTALIAFCETDEPVPEGDRLDSMVRGCPCHIKVLDLRTGKVSVVAAAPGRCYLSWDPAGEDQLLYVLKNREAPTGRNYADAYTHSVSSPQTRHIRRIGPLKKEIGYFQYLGQDRFVCITSVSFPFSAQLRLFAPDQRWKDGRRLSGALEGMPCVIDGGRKVVFLR